MRFFIIIILLLPMAILLAETPEPGYQFNLPQYMSPIYDSFSRSYLNVYALGRGNTGLTHFGGSEQALSNPAGLRAPKSVMHLETNIKFPMQEIEQYGDARYHYPVPFGIFGFARDINQKFSAGISYNIPKSIYYDEFDIVMIQGGYLLKRQPRYYLHQVSGTLAYHRDNWHWGLSLHNQVHQFEDITFLRSFDRVGKFKYLLRPETGVIYQAKPVSIGLKYLPPSSFEMETDYQNFDTTLPQVASLGLNYDTGKRNYSLEAEYEQTSQVDSAFDDRIILRSGYEVRIRNYAYRIGFSNFPSVFKGKAQYPVNNNPNADQAPVWNNVQTYSMIEDSDQYLLSFGFSFYHKYGNISGATVFDVARKTKMAQFQIALTMYWDSLKSKDILKFK